MMMTDDGVCRELGSRLTAARLAQNLSQESVAKEAAISKSTLRRIEGGQSGVELRGLIRVLRTLGLLPNLNAVVPEPSPNPIALMKLHEKERKRASGMRDKARPAAVKPWRWGK